MDALNLNMFFFFLSIFVAKNIRVLQNELKSKEDELRWKDMIIVELEAKLEA